MIYYDRFSNAKVFEDPKINVFFNQLFTTLINHFERTRVEANLIVDGMVSLLIQDEVPLPQFNKVELITADFEIFKYLKANLKLQNIKDYQATEDLIIISLPSDDLIYIKFTTESISVLDEKGISIRNKTEII